MPHKIFKNIKSLNSLFTALINHIYFNNHDSIFDGCSLKYVSDANKNIVIELLKKECWIFDYFPNGIEKCRDEKSEIYSRGHFSAFIKRELADDFSYEMSLCSNFVGLHDHLNEDSYIFKNGVKKKWNSEEDFTTRFKVIYDNLGNPTKFIKTEHIWDYGSQIEEIKNILNDQQLINSFLEKYVEISVIEPNFKTNNGLFIETFDIIEKLTMNG
jgi:hypothetical protein